MDGLLHRIAAIASDTPQRIAIVEDARRLSYAELWARIQAFASELARLGIQSGERVAIALPNSIEAAVACYGAWMVGAVVVPLNVQARTRDFSHWLAHSGARHVLYERGHADVVQALAGLTPAPASIVVEGQQFHFDAHPDGRATAETSDVPAGTAVILYTSGTTGEPKGVMLSHANLLANAQAVVAYLGLGPEDRVLSVLPFYYAYGASVLHTHLISGACVVLAPNLLFPHLVVEKIESERITGFSGVPSTYALLLERVALANYDLSSLRYLTQAGGAMSTAMASRLRAALPAPALFLMYGQTEATSRISWLPPERFDDKPGSVGIAVQGAELKIVQDDGTPAPAQVTGEVWVRGSGIMLGYHRNPETTARVLQGGWLRTGDLGHLDEEGFLFLLGRRSDMIKTGAHRVHPGDIEEVIAEMAGISEVAVVGIDDEILGQVIKAFIVASEIPPRAEDRVKAHCRARLAPYKIPRHIAFVDALPRTASGKVKRVQLMQPQSTP
jgi:acyl-CoA synthetase (AMP-forming)/AMP-acid ligase II